MLTNVNFCFPSSYKIIRASLKICWIPWVGVCAILYDLFMLICQTNLTGDLQINMDSEHYYEHPCLRPGLEPIIYRPSDQTANHATTDGRICWQAVEPNEFVSSLSVKYIYFFPDCRSERKDVFDEILFKIKLIKKPSNPG